MPGIFLSTIKRESDLEIFSPKKRRRSDRNSGVKQERQVDLPSPKNSRLSKLTILLLSSFCVLLLLLFLNGFSSSDEKVFNVTRIHPDFFGRSDEIAHLKKSLVDQSGVPILAVSGESGIGKTELAIAFAHECKKHFSLVFWMDGNTEETINQSYSSLAETLGIQEYDWRKLKWRVHRALEKKKNQPWLLIFDDIKELPQNLPNLGGSILLTSRDKGICPPDALYEIKKNHSEAKLLMQKLTGEEESEALSKLLDELDYLPLLINYVGHYIAETPGFSVSNYHNIFSAIQKTDRSPLNKVGFRKHYPRSLDATYKITMDLLKEKEAHASEFLRHVVFLQTKNIPIDFVTQWVKRSKICTPSEIELVCGDILRELHNHSLIRFDFAKSSFSIHRLLQKVLINEDHGEKVNESVETLLSCFSVENYNPTHEETIRPFQKILPHCIALLHHVTKPTEASVKLALKVSRYFLDSMHHPLKAEQYLTLAKTWAETWDHPLKGRMLFLSGVLERRWASREKKELSKREKYQNALSYFHQAYDCYLRNDDNEDYIGIEQNPLKCNKTYQRAICLEYQGQTLKNLGLYDKAEDLLERALRAFQTIAVDGDHFDIARILREQGMILSKKGQYDIAMEKIKEAIAMQERTYGTRFASKPSVAATYRVMGDIFFEKGDYLQADHVYSKAIKVNQLAYHTEIHPYCLKLYQKRAEIFTALQRPSFALEMEKKWEEIEEKLRDPSSSTF